MSAKLLLENLSTFLTLAAQLLFLITKLPKMKRSIYYLLSIGSFTWIGCGSTAPLQVLNPAQIVLPDHIEVIATVDRSKPEKGFGNFLEGAITGEEIGQDRAGRQRALEGLTDALTRTPRFTVRSTGIELTGSKGGNSFAAPLSWAEIENICRQYDADAVATIETFDSDNFINVQQRRQKSKDKEGNETVRLVYDARQNLKVRMGWRIYDPQSQVILDEFTVLQETDRSATGDSEQQARNRLPAQRIIVQDVGFLAGEQYGMRIAPVWITVQRPFYTKGKGADKADMEKAGRMAKAGQWKEAAAIWQDVARTAPDPKTAGRAALNMAVANEQSGKLQSALDWAEKAYVEFNNKQARTYIEILKQRIYDQQRLQEQLKDKA